MSSVQQFYHVTEKIVRLLEEKIDTDTREETIEMVNQLLEKREVIMKEITPPFTKAEEEQGRQILKWNEYIRMEFEHVKGQVQLDMRLLQKTKDTKDKYVNPYQHINSDGMFYDKRSR